MNFDLTEERRMLADTLNRFIGDRYSFDVRERIARSPTGFSPELYLQLAELGIIGALFGESDHGFGGAGFDISVVFECLGRGLVVEPLLGALMAGRAIAMAGSAAQRRHLVNIINGSTIAAFAHAEPDARYELARVCTRATRTADGQGWVLVGRKSVVPHAEHAELLVVTARTAANDNATQGISLFIVPRHTPGLAVRGYPLIDGGRAADVMLHDVHVGTDALLGDPHAGYPALEHAIGCGVLALCSEAIGAMDIARRDTLEYLRTRKQFGVPIGSFQALQHRMADLLLEIEQARSAVINAAAALDREPVARERALSAAKATIGRVGTRVAEECIQLHGGIGMTWELLLSHYAKRLVMIDHQLGDEDHHLARYIALGRVAGTQT
jgi:alkylation response protein AidB-like acyl-CoA dehydrogenase